MTKDNKKKLRIIIIWTVITAAMFIWRYVNGTFSERYCLLPMISLGAEILFLTFWISTGIVTNSRRRTVIRSLLLTIMALGFAGKIIHVNPYAELNRKIAGVIAEKRNKTVKAMILSFNKHTRRYTAETAIPAATTYSTLPGSPNGVLPTYLSALSSIYPQVFAVWDMPAREKYQEGELDYLNNADGSRKKLLSSFTTRRQNRIRYLYEFNAGDAIQRKISELQSNCGDNLIKNGGMEQSAEISPIVKETLGEKRQIAFFRTKNQLMPGNYDLWWNHAWEQDCQGEIRRSAELPLAGKYSLFMKSVKPVMFLTSQWFPAGNYLLSFVHQGKKDSCFRVIVHIRNIPEKWILDRSPSLEERMVCDGQVHHTQIIITQDFLRPGSEFRVGIQMDDGEMKIDELNLRRM